MTNDKSEISSPKEHEISIDFYNLRGNKDEKIINSNEISEYIESKSRWFSYSFKEPVYITSLEVVSEGFSDIYKFEIELDLVDGTIHEERISVKNNSVEVRPFRLCKSIKFKPERKFFSDTRILRLTTTGLTFDEFRKFEDAIQFFDQRSKNLVERETALEVLKEKVDELSRLKTSLEGDIGKYKAELEQASNNLIATTEKREREQKNLRDIKEKLEAQEKLHLIKLTEVKDQEKKYSELVKELRIFPSEIAGFVREGNRNFIIYSIIGIPFLVIISIILHEIFSNSIDLTQLYKIEEEIDIWTIFLTRLPFVIVAVTLIEVCGYVLGRLIFEAIRINRQRLEFAKLSIIAKDVSSASSFNLDLSDEQVYDRETKLKMELLREHMKNYVGNEFEYKGTGIIAAIKGVADKFSQKSG